MIKMIVCDMDGTLLNSDNKISSLTLSFLKECQRKGIILVLASGRSYPRLKPYYDLLNMSAYHSYLIEVNGLYINHLKTKQRERFTAMEKSDAIKIFELTKDLNLELTAFLDAGLRYYVPECLIPLKQAYIKENHLPFDFPLTATTWNIVGDMRDGYPDQYRIFTMDELPKIMNKVVLIQDAEVIEIALERLKNKCSVEFEFTRSSQRMVEIMKKGVTKGNALLKIMYDNQIAKDEVLVFGDGENDYSMFDVVTHPVIMKNAPDYVKKRAKEVSEYDNNEDGIYYACLKYID